MNWLEEFGTYYTTLLQEGRLRDMQLQALKSIGRRAKAHQCGKKMRRSGMEPRLLHAPEWSRIRQLAKDALRSLDLDLNQAEG